MCEAPTIETERSDHSEVSDSISRQSAIDAVRKNTFRLTFAEEQNCEGHVAWSAEAVYSDVMEGALLELPSAQPEPKWIPVTERLPEEEKKRYWVCTDTEYQCECRWTNNRFGMGEFDEWGWSIFDIPHYSHVVAWMPLPEPYREERRTDE